MRFQFTVESQNGEEGFTLFLHNLDVSRAGKIILADALSMAELKRWASQKFPLIQWCDGDDPLHDSTEYFTL